MTPLALATWIVALCPLIQERELQQPPEGPVVGEPLPAFEVTALDGRKVDHLPQPGRVGVLVYLAANDHPSERVVADVTRLVGTYGEQRVDLAYLMSEVRQQTYFEKLWAEHGVTAPLGVDRERQVFRDLALPATPTTVVLAPDGAVVHTIPGRPIGYLPLLDSYLRFALGELDAAGLADELEARSFGATSRAKAARSDGVRGLARGEALPPLGLVDLAGAPLDPAGQEGKVLVLVYLAAEQRNSELALQEALEVVAGFERERVLPVLVTAEGGDRAYFEGLWTEHDVREPLYLDPGRALYGRLGLFVFPTTLVVDAEGRLAHVVSTRRSNYAFVLDAFVRAALGELSEGELDRWLEERGDAGASPRAMALRHRAVAQLLIDRGLLGPAELELLAATELDPDDVHLRLDLAELYLAMDLVPKGLELLGEVLAADGTHRRALTLQGLALFRAGSLDEAEPVLLRSLDLNPDPARVHHALGRIYEQRGDLARAAEHYRKGLEARLASD